MSETEDLLAVYGAIDIAVEGDDTGESRARVAALIPHYESPELHWYSDFLEWRRDEGVELPESVGETLESVDLALRNLAETEPGSNRLAARRLLALYAVAQAREDLFGPGGELGEQVQGALAAVLSQRLEVGEDAGGRANEAARLLHEFMAQDILSSDAQNADERWSVLVSKVGLYVSVGGLELRPCTGRLKKRKNAKGNVATLESVFDVYDVDFERVVTFIQPDNWPRCMDFWCEMNRIPPDDIHRYDELVSTNCPRPHLAVFTARAVLDFKFRSPPNAAIAGYTLAPVRQPPDGLLVDEGLLAVSRMRGFVRVETTKAVQFDRAFSGEQLAMIACALGWTEKGKDMMYNCARLPEEDLQRTRRRAPDRVSRGGEFPGRILRRAARRSTSRRAAPVSRKSTGGPTPGGPTTGGPTPGGPTPGGPTPGGPTPGGPAIGGPATGRSRRRATSDETVISDIARQTAAAIRDCVDDQAAYMEEWADRVADEDYGYQDMADDMARAGVRMVRESARIMDLAVRNARLGSAGARGRRAAQPVRAAEPYDEDERP